MTERLPNDSLPESNFLERARNRIISVPTMLSQLRDDLRRLVQSAGDHKDEILGTALLGIASFGLWYGLSNRNFVAIGIGIVVSSFIAYKVVSLANSR